MSEKKNPLRKGGESQGLILGLYRDNGRENGNCYITSGHTGVRLGIR